LRFDISDAILLPAVLPPRLISWLVNRKTPRASPAREFIAPLRRARCVRARSGGKINDFISRARHRRAKTSSVARECVARMRAAADRRSPRLLESPDRCFTSCAIHRRMINTRAVCLRDASRVECGIEARRFEFRICAIAQWRFDKAQQDHRQISTHPKKKKMSLSLLLHPREKSQPR